MSFLRELFYALAVGRMMGSMIRERRRLARLATPPGLRPTDAAATAARTTAPGHSPDTGQGITVRTRAEAVARPPAPFSLSWASRRPKPAPEGCALWTPLSARDGRDAHAPFPGAGKENGQSPRRVIITDWD